MSDFDMIKKTEPNPVAQSHFDGDVHSKGSVVQIRNTSQNKTGQWTVVSSSP